MTRKIPIRNIWAALLIVLVVAARVVPGARTIDDAYITFRYARNVLAGDGFTYNPGERVQGTTTPLYTLLLAGLAVPLGDDEAPFAEMALWVNALADAGTALLLVWLGRRLGSSRAGAAAGLAWAVAPFSVTFAIGGLETSVYVFLLTATVAAFAAGRRALTALLAGLAVLTRPDALLLLGPLALQRLWLATRPKEKADRLHWSEFAALLPAVAWYVFATVYFGSPVAHSVQAKLGAYRLGSEEAFVRLLQHYATPWMQQGWAGGIGIWAGLVIFPFLYLVGAWRGWRQDARLRGWLAYPWIYFAAFAALNPLIFRWYLTPPLPAYLLVTLAGLDELLTRLVMGKVMAVVGWRRWGLALVVAALPMLSLVSDWRIHPDHGTDRPAPQMAYIKLELLYRQAAEKIGPMLSAEKTLAAGDVGVLGYFTGARILDTVGLNSPEALGYYPLDPRYYVINYAVAPDLIVDEQPDAVVILEVYGRMGLLEDERFLSSYRLVETIPTDMYGSQGMVIYEHVETDQ